jgi:hypothetical protein
VSASALPRGSTTQAAHGWRYAILNKEMGYAGNNGISVNARLWWRSHREAVVCNPILWRAVNACHSTSLARFTEAEEAS